MIAPAQLASSNCGLDGYVSIPMEGLQFLDAQQINIYRCRKPGATPQLLNDAQWNIDEEQLLKLRALGDLCLFFSKQDLPTVSQRLQESLAAIIAADSIPLESRFALLQLSYATDLEHSFRKTHLTKLVPLAQDVGRHMAVLARQGELSLSLLYPLLHHNSQHYTHLTNVAAYAITLAQLLETFSAEELEQIAVGSLLHEVGKLFLPSELLSKQGRLSAQDTQELERVPQLAYEALLPFKGLQFGQLMMAYQQHERVDGTGYPVRSLSRDIHPWAKLLAVADELDAITCQCPSRAAVGLQEGLLHLTNLANNKLNPKMVLCLITNSQSQ